MRYIIEISPLQYLAPCVDRVKFQCSLMVSMLTMWAVISLETMYKG